MLSADLVLRIGAEMTDDFHGMAEFDENEEEAEEFDPEFLAEHAPRPCPHCGKMATFHPHPIDAAHGGDYMRCSECDKRI